MKNRSSKKIPKNLFYKIISLLLVFSSLSFLGVLFYINLLPTKYLMIILLFILLFNVLNIFLINLKRLKKKIKKTLASFMIIATIGMAIVSFYGYKTVGVLTGNGDSKYKLEHYSVVVLNDSKYKKLKDIEKEKLGYFVNSTGADKANKELEKKVNVKFQSYKTSDSLVQDLLDSKLNAIIIEDSIKNIMAEEISDFETLTKVIYTFTIKTEVETTLKEVDVTEEPFAVYISGIDTYGKISSVSRSDVNMVMVVNPKIRQILLVSIPRDYYVQLHGTTGNKDKLTHAGIYGIDMSIQTIEDLLELDINYYIKVNFTSVIDIVDAMGGLDVYSEYTFTSYSGYKFKKGMNSVNGEQALDFARTRKAFIDGDRQRGKNQQAIIEAIVRKATDKSIITKYSSLLDAIDGKYQTNLGMKKMMSLVKMQLKDMSPWTVTSYSLTGNDSKDYTYTYNQLLYVMKPDQESIDEAIKLIDNVLKDEQLETSYNDIGGSSNKVTQVQIDSNQHSTIEDKKDEEKPKEDLEQDNDDSKENNKEEQDNQDKDNSLKNNEDKEEILDETLDNDNKNDEEQIDNNNNSSSNSDDTSDLDNPLQDILPSEDITNN